LTAWRVVSRAGVQNPGRGSPRLDARSPFLWTTFGNHGDRRRLIREGLIAIGKLAVFAIVLDLVYQLIVFRRIYPAEAIDVALLLAIAPYFALRGPVNRIVRLWSDRGASIGPAVPARWPMRRPLRSSLLDLPERGSRLRL
jgi:hypothetical protein